MMHDLRLAGALLLGAWLASASNVAPQHHQLSLVADVEANGGDSVLRAVAMEADLQLSTVATLRDGVASAVSFATEAASDSEMDLGNLHGADSGPATLAEYCSGAATEQEKQTDMKEGTRVMANWEGYGTMYPGRIKDENVDGTVDIKYDDGFHENSVHGKHVQIHPDEEKKEESSKTVKKRDDAACEMQEFLEKTKEKLQELNQMIVGWMASQRAKIAGDSAAPTAPPSLQSVTLAPPSAPAAAPPASPASAPSSDELEKLKAQLADRDLYIEELEKRFADNNQELQKYAPVAPPAPAGIQTVDNLIQQYQAQIAQRDARIKELEAAIAEQEKELAKLSGKQLSLAEIDAAVRMLEGEGAKMEQKRDELEKAGKLDEDLAAIVNKILEALKKMRAKVDKLLDVEAQAKARESAADLEEQEAAKAARLRAKELGIDPEKAAAEAIEKVKRKNEANKKTADLEVMRAAQEVGKDLSEAEDGAEKLDTGLHPHGAKWWRYRYEHSYIEAILMIFISFLMLVWSEFIFYFRVWLNRVAAPNSADNAVRSAEDLEEQDAHGAAYLSWLRMLTEQMCVCVFVFLTVWVIAKTALLQYAPMLIRPSPDMRVPLEPDEYRRLALDICTIFFIAIVFYFSLMFAVARETRYETQKYDELDEKVRSSQLGVSTTAAAVNPSPRKKSLWSAIHTTEDYEKQLKRFETDMTEIFDKSSDDEEMQSLRETIGGSLDRFPLHLYLTLCVRMNVAKMFFFGWVMWLPTIALFLALCLLHRFAHMGYVRIMGFFAFVVLAIILYMTYLIASIKNRSTTSAKDSAGGVSKISTEICVLGLLQFSLFFVCYGVARMICQSWMWELHFWPVLVLTIVALISAFLFVWFIAPAIPSFCAAMAMPPYVDRENIQCMKNVVKNPSGSTSP